MPIYEYVCTKCGHEFEVIQSFSDKPIRKCEQCGARVHKKVSQSSFHLKGSGWYVTDYSSKHPGSKPTEKSESDSSAKDASTDKKKESKSDTKSSSKTDTKPST